MSHYIHNIDPFIIRFPEHWVIQGIRWYGLCYVITFAFALLAMNFYSKSGKSTMSKDQNFSFLNYAIIGVILGGRIGFMILYNLSEFLSHPMKVFAIWEGGMSSHGGFVGVMISIFLFCRHARVKVLEISDICATIAPFGFFVGRLANFINGELFGKITNCRWGVIFPMGGYLPRHPSQIYEGILEGLILFLYVQIRFWRGMNLCTGRISGEFLIIYSVFRIFTECFRMPDASLICNLSRGQFYSIFLIIFGIILLFISNKKTLRI